ncbi:MAG: metal-dependent transcriptional regulator [Elusimicrobia bacterium]|nr:metal-dependent transcriptional regulator [Elusimicrobiota bacterium]
MYMGAMSRLKPSALEEEEEALGVVWHHRESGRCAAQELREVLAQGVAPGVYERLLEKGLLRASGAEVEFTAEGGRIAEDVTRRHRLAERMLVDILDVRSESIDEDACRWEHTLSPEATRAICTLLGHPRHCPHGTPIPPGDCCREVQSRADPIVMPLHKLRPGETGKIVYLALEDKSVLQKLLALGLTPGSRVALRQREPSVVVQAGETVIALEAELAAHIAVKKA